MNVLEGKKIEGTTTDISNNFIILINKCSFIRERIKLKAKRFYLLRHFFKCIQAVAGKFQIPGKDFYQFDFTENEFVFQNLG